MNTLETQRQEGVQAGVFSLNGFVVSALLWSALFAIAGFVAYQHIFSTFAEYDDEGYVMISLRSFMDGHPLYDETFSQYGPAFYLVEGTLQRLTGQPITHNVVRLKTIAKWLLIAAACAFFVRRLTRDDGTRSRPLSMLAFCLVFLHLDRLCLEPGHPQELCALGVVTALLCSLGIANPARTTRLIASALLGVVCATLLLTKLNVGIFLTAAAISGMVVLLPPTRLKYCLLACVYGGIVALPLLLYRNHLLEIHSGLLAGITAIGGVTVVNLAKKSRLANEHATEGSQVGHTDLAGFACASLVTVVAVLVWALGTGISNEGLWYGLVQQHTGFQQDFFHQPPVSALLVLVGGVLTAYGWKSRGNSFYVTALVLIGCLVAYFTETWRPLVHGLETRGRADLLMSVGPGLLVLLLVGNQSRDQLGARVFLALVALLQPLAAYPTPGTQTAVGTFAYLVACVLLLNDGINALENADVAEIFPLKAVGALVAMAIMVLATRSVFVANRRANLEPLALPGAERLQLDAETVAEKQWLVAQLKQRADTFVFGEQGLNCLYFWSNIDPPTALNTTFWPFIMRESDQNRVVAALEAYPRACVARTMFDARLPTGPLSSYIKENFQRASQHGSTEIWVRGQQTVDVGLEKSSVESEPTEI